MERCWLGLCLLAVLGAAASGCGSPCDNALERYEVRYEECGIDLNKPEAPPGPTVCSDESAEYLECHANCAESASCGALSGEDAEGALDYYECYGSC